MQRRSGLKKGAFAALLGISWAGSAAAQPLAERIDAVINGSSVAGNTWGVLVTDANAQTVYYSRNADQFLAPASNVKLFTTAAAYGLLGPDYAFQTNVYHTGSRSGASITGDLALVVEHDPTWNSSTLSSSTSAFNVIAQRVRNAGITSISGGVRVYGAAIFGYGSTSIYTNLSNQASWNGDVADALVTALRNAGVTVSGTGSGFTGFNPPGGSTLLFTHESTALAYGGEPLDVQTASIPLNKVSNNPMAELVLRHMGWKATGVDSFAAGEAQVVAWLRDEAGLPDTQSIEMFDGSGLSWDNRFSARQTVLLTEYMQRTFPQWLTTLPIGAVDGTIASRFGGTSAAGRVHAKTGTLSISIALSGYVDHPTDGNRYLFSFITNAPPTIAQSASRNTIDAAVVEITNQPVSTAADMIRVVNNGDGTATAEWSLAGGASSYNVYLQSNLDQPAAPISVPAPGAAIAQTRSGGDNVAWYSETGEWLDSSASSTAAGVADVGSRFALPGPDGDTNGRNDQARFTPQLSAGTYDVQLTTYRFSSANARNVTVRFSDAGGTEAATIDLTSGNYGDTWTTIGELDIPPAAAGAYVEFDNTTQSNTGSDLENRMVMSALRFIPQTASYTFPLGNGDVRFVSVAPVTGGNEGKRTDTYAVGDGPGASPILIVDGNDRWAARETTANPQGLNHEFAALIGEAIAPEGHGFDSVANETVEAGGVALGDYQAVLWILGEEANQLLSFSGPEREAVQLYLGGGGALVVSGAEWAWELNLRSGDEPALSGFLANTLRADYVADDAGTFAATPVAGGLLAGAGSLNFAGSPLDVNFPDVLAPAGGSSAVLNYQGGTGGAAALWYPGPGAVLAFGFPVEALSSRAQRRAVLAPFLNAVVEEIAALGNQWMIY